MKNKITNKLLSLLILVTLLIPLFSNAWIIVPSVNLTIVVNTEGQENNFNFKIQSEAYNCEYDPTTGGEICSYSWQDIDNFSLQTINFTAEKNFPEFGAYGPYKITQEIQAGFRIDSISCISEDPENLFAYQPDGIIFTPKAWTSIICSFNNKKVTDKTPVLIVPGITGTEMKKDSELLWADITRMLNPLQSDSFLDPLAFNDDLSPSDVGVFTGDVLRNPNGLFDYTQSLISEFINQGYIENETLFTFPYDWRYGVSGVNGDGSPNGEAGKTNSDLLKEKIIQILQQTGASKVDVIAHSMGGLIVKKYVIDNTDPANHKINKAVFVGVPNTGSVKAVKGLILGDNMGVYFGPLGLNDNEMRKISANMPGVYDLLPSQKYYDTKGSFIKTIDYKNPINLFDDEVKDLNYQEFENYLVQDKNLNGQAFNNSENLHTQSYDDFDLRTAGIDLYRITGCKAGTMNKITERKEGIMSLWEGMEFGKGDGTVILESSTNLPIDQDKKYFALVSDHGKMLSQNGIRQQIANIISGSNLAVSSSIITQDVNQCQLNGKAIEVFSPVDIFVTDQNGNKLGLAEDKSTINEIPNASFEIMGEHKFVYLPTDNNQTYTINMQGTGTGTYTINVKDIQNTETTKIESFINLPVTASLIGTVNLAEARSQTTLTVKETPSSEVITIYPTPEDTIAPEVVIEFDPVKKDLKFSGKDNLSLPSEITITDKDDIITLTDEAGNTTEIKLKDKNRKITMKAEIKSIKYNGKLADTSKNKMAFLWLYDKNKNLKMLSQYVASTLRHSSGQEKDYNVLAVYNGKNTTLLGKDASGKILKTEKGLKILKVTTNNGDLNWSY